jgi:hypothetical protein
MSYTLGEAAKATGKSKATISKAIKSGKISAAKGENGAFKIDPSELFRVYPMKQSSEQELTPETPQENTDSSAEIKILQVKLEAAEKEIQDKADQISKAEAREEDWRRQATNLTALLADQREKAAEPPKRGFWARLMG